MLRQLGILLLVSCLGFVASAQDTLPAFTLVNKGNSRIIISWSNTYKDIRQLSIQRSADSTKNFKSILTLPDPTVPQNGYVDSKAPFENMYYRLYILLDSGKYVFTKSKMPVLDTARRRVVPKEITAIAPPEPELTKTDTSKVAKEDLKIIPGKVTITEEPKTLPNKVVAEDPKPKEPEKKEIVKPEVIKPKEIPERMIFIKKRDTLVGQVGERSIKRFRDSISLRTKDTVSFNTEDTLVIKTFVPKEVYRPSKFVYTEKDGNVKIALPLAAEKKYTIKFFDEFNTPVFEIKQIKDSMLTLDKSNFVHAGWFKFELYEDGQLKEKNKLLIPKDF